jgi:hypothetical protein
VNKTVTNGPRIVGFLGEYADGTDLLICARPVIEDADGHYAALSDDWTWEHGIRKLAPGDLEYANLGLDQSDPPIPAREGALVWLAGGRFVNALTADPRLGTHRAYFAMWPKYRAGFSYRVADRRQFDELRRGIYHDVKTAFLNSLFGPLEVRLGVSETLFRALSALPPEDESEQMLLEALFYYECRDADQVALVRECAVDEGLFRSSSSFDASLASYRADMERPRLHEAADAPARRQQRPQPKGADEVLDWLMGLEADMALRSQGPWNVTTWRHEPLKVKASSLGGDLE